MRSVAPAAEQLLLIPSWMTAQASKDAQRDAQSERAVQEAIDEIQALLHGEIGND